MSQRVRQLGEELETIGVIEDMTDILSSIASVKVRSIRQRTLNSKIYFNDLWEIYEQLRINDLLLSTDAKANSKHLILLFSSSNLLSNANDTQIINQFIADYDKERDDVLAIGSHGVRLLKQYGIKPARAFEVPDVTKQFSTEPIVDIIRQYSAATAYYHVYHSLSLQQVNKLKLLQEPQSLVPEERMLIDKRVETAITYDSFIFEPTLDEVVATLEQVMLRTSIAQLLFETRLSQFASRFLHMSMAHNRAEVMYRQLNYKYLTARRYERDEANRQTAIAARMQIA